MKRELLGFLVALLLGLVGIAGLFNLVRQSVSWQLLTAMLILLGVWWLVHA